MENYKILFEVAQVEQLKQMRANEHKGRWDDIEGDIVSKGILHNFEGIKEAEFSEEVIRRLANIANFAAMGILSLKKEEE